MGSWTSHTFFSFQSIKFGFMINQDVFCLGTHYRCTESRCPVGGHSDGNTYVSVSLAFISPARVLSPSFLYYWEEVVAISRCTRLLCLLVLSVWKLLLSTRLLSLVLCAWRTTPLITVKYLSLSLSKHSSKLHKHCI